MNTLSKKLNEQRGLNRVFDALEFQLLPNQLRKNLTGEGYLVIDLNTEEGLKSMPKNWKRGYDEASVDLFVDGTDIWGDENPIYPLSHDVKLFYLNKGFTRLSERYTRFLIQENLLKIDSNRDSENEDLVEFLNLEDGYVQPFVPFGELDVEILEYKVPHMTKGAVDDKKDQRFNELILSKGREDYHVMITEDNFLKNRQRVIGYRID